MSSVLCWPGWWTCDGAAGCQDDYRYIMVNRPDLNATGTAIANDTIPSGDEPAIR
jgi:hypothetical protein